MKTLPESFNVQIWCGLKEGYEGEIHSIAEVENICQEYADNFSDCVTVTPTSFIYKKGREPGVIVGFISYPRFPRDKSEITQAAINLARVLMKDLKQNRVTITTPEISVMLEKEEDLFE